MSIYQANYSADNPLAVTLPATAADAFGRQRVSEPTTLFDSKQVFDNQPLVWDDQEVSGSGTTSTYNTNKASTSLAVAATTAGLRRRQTHMRFNYQPGKSQLVLCTGQIDSTGTGIRAAMGLFDDENGIFVEADNGVCSMVKRSYTTGSAVDTAVAQADWNGDKLDGTGPSGFTLDFTKAQIWWCDLEWLGVGSVRTGFVIDGQFILCHTFHHANSVSDVYMSTANLPVRYEIENDGTGAATEMQHICSSVMSEGGEDETGVVRSINNGTTHVDANLVGTFYALLGMRLKSGYEGATLRTISLNTLSVTNDNYLWELRWNPTVAGTFTYAGLTDSAVDYATGATANTVTGGYTIRSGYGSQQDQKSSIIPGIRHIGADISGTPDELVLCVTPLSSNLDIYGAITWTELT